MNMPAGAERNGTARHGPAGAPDLRALPARTSHIVRPWAASTPDATALLEGGLVLSYAQLLEAVAAVGRWLQARGVRGGDRVMVVGENSIALAVLVLAIGDIDAWPAVANARLSEREIDTVHAHSGARLLLFTTAVSDDARRHAVRCGAAAEDVPWIGAIGVGATDTSALPEPVAADGARQVGALIYTSGTTGAPKGVMLSHRGILFTAAVGGVLRGLQPDDRVYGVLPMSHIVGLSSVLVATLMFGACLELVPRFDAADTLAALQQRGITRLNGVPTLVQRLLAAGGARIACPALRSLGVAGAPLDQTLKAAAEAAFGLPLDNGYGITECSPTIASTRRDDPRPDTTVGRCIPGIEVRLVDREGGTVAAGSTGELHVRGPNVMLGYYNAAAATAAAIDTDGWFNTGDLARFDGPHLHIVGRTKELIIRSGFNVYPPEVEAVLAAHPAVAACAVVGRSVAGNEEVVAFVQLRDGVAGAAGWRATGDAAGAVAADTGAGTPGDIAADIAADIADFAAQRLAPYKRPTEIVIRQSLPATSAGKIIKHQLAKEAAQHGRH